MIKWFFIKLSGMFGFEKVEVMVGGVVFDEIDFLMFVSKIVFNFYFVGEILDFDGFIGGYNF